MKASPSSQERGVLGKEANLVIITPLKWFIERWSFAPLCAAVYLIAASVAFGQGDDRLVGMWLDDEGYKTVELLFRSDGGYQLESKSNPPSEFGSIVDRGRYEVSGQTLTLTPYQFDITSTPDVYQFELDGDSLSLTSSGSDLPRVYQFEPGSRESVLAREQASHDLVRTWTRHLLFVGDEEYTFRPGGYYSLKNTRDSGNFPPVFERGRYERTGSQLTVKPYSANQSGYQVDIFGTTLTLISTSGSSGSFTSYEEVPGSAAEIAAKAAEAQTFLSDPNWQVGVWQIEIGNDTINLLLRPDGVYSATNTTPVLRRVLRGRYTLADQQMHMVPFVGQERYTLDDANFGIAEQTYTLDYYDGVLELIDLKASSQSVTLAQKNAGSQAAVLETARQAQAERTRDGWSVGIWQVNDPAAWMEFTFRPDNRYIAKSGTNGVPSEVERGQDLVTPGKITLAPYAGNGPARGFEYDLYDGDLFLIGDAHRLVVLRKIPGSEIGVIDKSRNPDALKGERGSILGLWTANRPTESVQLTFRPDWQFRLQRCSYNHMATNNAISSDYGLYSVDMATRTLVYESRFVDAQNQQLDFYGDTMTIYGGLTNSTPSTYTVNLGSVDAAIAASLAADAQEAQTNAQWMARVPIAPRDPNAAQTPIQGIPADPKPGQIFPAPTVFTQYKFYRRLIPNYLDYVTMDGKLGIVTVLDVHEWNFFPNGRVLVRFVDHLPGWPMPNTIEDVTDAWGAYEIEPKPNQTDILHFYADNNLNIKTDQGEQMAMTLENGRRDLFWGRDDQVLGDWAAEQKPILCQLPGNADASLINTGVSLSTEIAPDIGGQPGPLSIAIRSAAPGSMTVSGTTELARSLVLERAASLASPTTWEPLRTNSVPAGPFSFTISQATNATAFFRMRTQ